VLPASATTLYARHVVPRPQNRSLDDFVQLGAARIGDDDLEHESVKLRFRKWKRAFLLDGILSGQHEEWLRQRSDRSGNGDGAFLHGFQQCRLCFRRCPVDLVGQQKLCKNRPFAKFNFVSALVVCRHHVRAENVRRHEIRRELDSPKFQVKHSRDGFGEFSFAKSRNAFQQHVPSADQCCQRGVDHMTLPDDHSGDIVSKFAERLSKCLSFIQLVFVARHARFQQVRHHADQKGRLKLRRKAEGINRSAGWNKHREVSMVRTAGTSLRLFQSAKISQLL
jgi:hypothetical protein